MGTELVWEHDNTIALYTFDTGLDGWTGGSLTWHSSYGKTGGGARFGVSINKTGGIGVTNVSFWLYNDFSGIGAMTSISVNGVSLAMNSSYYDKWVYVSFDIAAPSSAPFSITITPSYGGDYNLSRIDDIKFS